jgi:hypothetical protein
MVRFEDLIFHPKKTVTEVCQCAGGELKHDEFQYIVESAKKGAVHGRYRTGYVDAIIKYGRNENRWSGMTVADLAFASKYLDQDLMKRFGYQPPNSQYDV